MGDLTSAQITAIAAGAPVAQKLEIVCARTPTLHMDYLTENVIHDDTDSSVAPCVTTWPVRRNTVYNVSPKSPGEIDKMRCDFVIDDSDGKSFTSSVDSTKMFYTTAYPVAAPYMEYPLRTLIRHSFYVKVAGAWSELPGSPWLGKIVGMTRDKKSKALTITAEAWVATELVQPWALDHSHTTQVQLSYTPSGLTLGTISTGVSSGGEVWAQFNASESVSYEGTIYYVGAPVGSLYTITPGSATSSPFTVQVSDASPATGWSRAAFTITLTATSGSRQQSFTFPILPVVSVDQTPVARPW